MIDILLTDDVDVDADTEVLARIATGFADQAVAAGYGDLVDVSADEGAR